VAQPLDDEQQIEFTAVADRARGLAGAIQQWLAHALEGQVYWVDTTTARPDRADLVSAPIEVGPALQAHLYSKVPTVVLTSATLRAGGQAGFRHCQGRLGLEDCPTLQLGSPFDYRRQGELQLFRRMPDPSADPAAYEEAVLARIPEFVERSRG